MLTSDPHCSTAPSARRAARAVLLSLSAAALLTGSGAALCAGAYAGSPTPALLSGATGSTEQTVVPAVRSAAEPANQPSAVTPPAPSASGGAGAAVPPAAQATLASATSAVTHISAAGPPPSDPEQAPAARTTASGLAQSQAPARSAPGSVGTLVATSSGDPGSPVPGGVGRGASQILTPPAGGPASAPRPATRPLRAVGAIGGAAKQLAAAVVPAAGAIQGSVAALGAVMSGASSGPAPPRVSRLVQATGLPSASLSALAEAAALAGPSPLAAPAELLGPASYQLRLPAVGLPSPGFPGAGYRTIVGVAGAVGRAPPPVIGPRGFALAGTGSSKSTADPAAEAGAPEATSAAFVGTATARGCVLGGLEERLVDSCAVGAGRLGASLAGPARGLDALAIIGNPEPSLRVGTGAGARGRPGLRPVAAPGASAGLPVGVSGSAAGGSGPGVALFLSLSCLALLAACLFGRTLGLSAETWRAAPFLLSPERPG